MGLPAGSQASTAISTSVPATTVLGSSTRTAQPPSPSVMTRSSADGADGMTRSPVGALATVASGSSPIFGAATTAASAASPDGTGPGLGPVVLALGAGGCGVTRALERPSAYTPATAAPPTKTSASRTSSTRRHGDGAGRQTSEPPSIDSTALGDFGMGIDMGAGCGNATIDGGRAPLAGMAMAELIGRDPATCASEGGMAYAVSADNLGSGTDGGGRLGGGTVTSAGETSKRAGPCPGEMAPALTVTTGCGAALASGCPGGASSADPFTVTDGGADPGGGVSALALMVTPCAAGSAAGPVASETARAARAAAAASSTGPLGCDSARASGAAASPRSSSKPSMASLTSSAVCGRASGSFSMSRSTSASTAAGRPGVSVLGRGGVPFTCCTTTAMPLPS